MDSLTESTAATLTDATCDDPYIGSLLGQQYRIDKRLGQGGMGTVYQGVQLSVDRPVAVKVIALGAERTPELTARFRREAQAMAQLRHPNTVRLLDFGLTDHTRMYMVMEWLRGCDLESHLTQNGPLELTAALHIARQVAQALSEAHARGIVHRDLKPGNIFLSEVEGGDCFVKVMDFGVAGFLRSAEKTAITMRGEVLGTAAYMSPEQAQGYEVDARADLYSLGVILFEMLTGRPPFLAKTAVSLLLLHVSEPPPRVREVSPRASELWRVQSLLDRLLAKDRDARPTSAVEVISAIDALLAEIGSGSSSISGMSSIPPLPRPRSRQKPYVGAMLSLVAMAACAWFAWQRSGAADTLPERQRVLAPQAEAPSYTVQSLDWLGRLVDVFRSAHFVDVTIASVPSGATVALAGAELGKTPYRMQLKGPAVVELSLPGHAPQRLVVQPDGDPNLVVKLVPLPPYRSALLPPL